MTLNLDGTHNSTPQVCPKCGTMLTLDGHFPELIEGYLEIKCHCPECEWEGLEVYSATYLHHEDKEA